MYHILQKLNNVSAKKTQLEYFKNLYEAESGHLIHKYFVKQKKSEMRFICILNGGAFRSTPTTNNTNVHMYACIVCIHAAQ